MLIYLQLPLVMPMPQYKKKIKPSFATHFSKLVVYFLSRTVGKKSRGCREPIARFQV